MSEWIDDAADEIAGSTDCCDISSSDAGAIADVIRRHAPPRQFVVTSAWIHAHATLAGGWTRNALACLGVSWPPVKGWLLQLEGKSISMEQKDAFEACSSRASPAE